MLARAHTFTIEGLQTRPVTVEVDIRPGLPAFTIVGLADAAVREARDRVARRSSTPATSSPARRITANLAPGDVPKVGPGLDLALACAVLAASEQLPRELLASHALFGELSLDGEVRPCHGTLAVAQAAHEQGCARWCSRPRRRARRRSSRASRSWSPSALSSAARILRRRRRGSAAARRVAQHASVDPATPCRGAPRPGPRRRARAAPAPSRR